MPDGDKTVEQLNSEVSELESLVTELKTKILSETERKQKEKEINTKAEKLQGQLDRLSRQEGIDDKLSGVKDRAKIVLESCSDISNLESSIKEKGSKTDKKDISNKPTSAETTETAQTSTQSETQSTGKPTEEKGFFGKIGDGLSNMRSDVRSRDKWKEQPGKNLCYVGGTLLTGYALYRGVKGLWNRAFGKDKDKDKGKDKSKDKEEDKKDNDKEKDKKETSWRKKFLIGAGITTGTVIGGVEIYKHWNRISSWFKEKLGLSLSFEQAIQKVEGEVRNGKVDDDHFGVFNAHFEGGISYDENTQEICSYGQKTKIEKNGKKLQGMNVEFASREELIHAANIVNFAKRKLRGRGATSTPFCQTDWGGDIAFNCSTKGKKEFLSASNSNEWSRILGTVGTVGGGILGGYCAGVKGAAVGGVGGGTGGYALGAYIDNKSTAGSCCETICRGKNFDEFINYLNRQTDESGKSIWDSAAEEHVDPNETPINGLLDNGKQGADRAGILADLENGYGEDQSGRRNLHIERDENKPEEYKICSYGQELKMTIKGGPNKKGEKIDYNKIKSIHIEKYEKYNSRGNGLNIDFPHTEEGLKEAIKTANLTNMIVEDRKGKGGETYPFFRGKYTTPPAFDMDTSGFRGNTILSRDAAKKFPTLFEDLKKGSDGGMKSALGFTDSHQKRMHEQAVQDKSDGSQYIKYLHQIGKGKFWKE